MDLCERFSTKMPAASSSRAASEPPVAVLVEGRRPGSWKPEPDTFVVSVVVPVSEGVPVFVSTAVDAVAGDAAVTSGAGPHTAANCAVLARSADACAVVQTEARIAGVIEVPSDPAPLPAPFTVDGVEPLQALEMDAVAGTLPFAFPTTQSDAPAPPLPVPAGAVFEDVVPPATDGSLPHTDDTSAAGVPLASFACARKQNAAVMSAEVGSLTELPALVPEVRIATV
jgi:hypothetical protein